MKFDEAKDRMSEAKDRMSDVRDRMAEAMDRADVPRHVDVEGGRPLTGLQTALVVFGLVSTLLVLLGVIAAGGMAARSSPEVRRYLNMKSM